MAEARRYIVAAAIKEGGGVCSVSRPGRHGDVIRQMATVGIPIPIVGQQGFLTSDGLFVDRITARKIAAEAGQIIKSCVGTDGVPFTREHVELFSEDVW